MGSINIGEVKNGAKLLFNNEPYACEGVDFVKPGKGAAVYTLRVRNLVTGYVLNKTFRSGDKVDAAEVMDADMEYLYHEAAGYVFMNTRTYDQVTVSEKAVGEAKEFLIENMSCKVTLWNDQPIAVQIPNSYVYEVIYTEPAVKGDTQSRVMKDAKLQTGAIVQVPTFVAQGERIIVNTVSKSYIGREKA